MENNFENKFETIQNRLTNLEQGTTTPEEYMINITKTTTIKHEIKERTDNSKSDITKVAWKIIAISPITDYDFERLYSPNTTLSDLYARTAVDFLIKELKYTQEECKKLDIQIQ